MTLREFITKLDAVPESLKDKTLKYCGEWEAEFSSFELMDDFGDYDNSVLLILMQ